MYININSHVQPATIIYLSSTTTQLLERDGIIHAYEDAFKKHQSFLFTPVIFENPSKWLAFSNGSPLYKTAAEDRKRTSKPITSVECGT